jgi:hypothetical protein
MSSDSFISISNGNLYGIGGGGASSLTYIPKLTWDRSDDVSPRPWQTIVQKRVTLLWKWGSERCKKKNVLPWSLSCGTNHRSVVWTVPEVPYRFVFYMSYVPTLWPPTVTDKRNVVLSLKTALGRKPSSVGIFASFEHRMARLVPVTEYRCRLGCCVVWCRRSLPT